MSNVSEARGRLTLQQLLPAGAFAGRTQPSLTRGRAKLSYLLIMSLLQPPPPGESDLSQ